MTNKIVNGINIDDSVGYIEKLFKVTSKPDAAGVSHLVPMKLWKAQRYYIENRTHRDIILKSRQMGLSTAVMADNTRGAFTIPYTRMAVITHKDSVSQFLLQTISRFWRNLPEKMRPQSDWHSARHIRLPKLDSYIHIDTAESDAIGFGESLNRVHLSEMSRWPQSKAKDLFNGITQTVGEGGFITIESTPKGRGGLFYQLYDAAKRGDLEYKVFFFPWWWDDNYRLPPLDGFKPAAGEEAMMDKFGLTPAQITWRRRKISEIGDDFFQEYPENDVDCWMASDISVFDGLKIREYMKQVIPGKQEGNVTIWKDVIGGEKYVMGVDVAGGIAKGDYSVASVLRVKTNEYVARIRGRIPPDLFSQEIMRLGRRYNDAEIGVERASHGWTVIRILMEYPYPNLYYYLDVDSLTGVEQRDVGWKTTVKSKPVMIDTLKASIRASDIAIWSENLLAEASAYIWNGTKAEPAGGEHDDELDALMIALQIREQSPIFSLEERYRVQSYVSIGV